MVFYRTAPFPPYLKNGRMIMTADKKPFLIEHLTHEHVNADKDNLGNLLRDIILGGQDGVVNVLGIVLGVAIATQDVRVVLIAGLAATFAESISMAAVAYTSTKAAQQYYQSRLHEEELALDRNLEYELKELKAFYQKRGIRGKALRMVLSRLEKNHSLLLSTIMHDELGLGESEKINPVREALVVGLSSFAGSFVPLLAFLAVPTWLSISEAMILSLFFSALVLFAAGAMTARLTIGNWIKSGLTLMTIGIIAALAGFAVGAYFGVGMI